MSSRLKVPLLVCAIVAVVVLFRSFLLIQLGHALVASSAGDSEPAHADAVLIPSADYLVSDTSTAVMEQAASLAKATGTKSIFMTCFTWYGVSTCNLAEAALAQQGHPIGIRAIRTGLLPDSEEAELALQALKQSGIRTVIVLLPNYKTRRLGGWYRKVAGIHGMAVTVVPSACHEFDVKTWWMKRESQKLFAYEVVRHIGLF